ncbi:transposase [Candidatus Uhrbacteria bacterium]|nr:transposase [Candidatus Uhrbacteria bacterium]
MPPILRPGHESQKQWREVLDAIPQEIHHRICAVVSDSFSGAGGLAKKYSWIFQRCQAHLLLRLSTLCGDNKLAVSWREGRQEIKRLMHTLMNTRDEKKVSTIVEQLLALGAHPQCPQRLRQIVKRTVRTLNEYRACYLHPELRLPATTNAVENTNGRIRSVLNRARGCRTPESLIHWITAFLWFHPTVKCRPKLPTELKR